MAYASHNVLCAANSVQQIIIQAEIYHTKIMLQAFQVSNGKNLFFPLALRG